MIFHDTFTCTMGVSNLWHQPQVADYEALVMHKHLCLCVFGCLNPSKRFGPALSRWQDLELIYSNIAANYF